MKKLLLLVAAIPAFTSFVANAQPRKGDWMVGVNIIPLSFKAGYFLSNRFSAGLDVSPHYSYKPAGQQTNINVSANLFARYYFASREGMKPGKFYLFGDYSIGYQFSYSKDKPSNISVSAGNLRTGIAPGLVYLINDRISVDGALRVTYYDDFKNNWNHIHAAPEVGVQIYLSGKKKQAK